MESIIAPVTSFIELTCSRPKWRCFRAVGVTSYDPSIAVQHAFGMSRTDVIGIGSFGEQWLCNVMSAKIKATHSKNKRCILTIDTTNFPTIFCQINTIPIREMYTPEEYELDTFTKDVTDVWESYNMATEVPLIRVNLNTNITQLSKVAL